MIRPGARVMNLRRARMWSLDNGGCELYLAHTDDRDFLTFDARDEVLYRMIAVEDWLARPEQGRVQRV